MKISDALGIKNLRIWEDYLAKQLLIPAVQDIDSSEKLYILAGQAIKICTSIRLSKDKCVIKFVLNNGDIYYYPQYFPSLLEAFKVEENLMLICLGKIEPSLNDWLIYFPHFNNNYIYIER